MSAYKNHLLLTYFEEKESDMVRLPYVYKPDTRDKTHIVLEGERLDMIAYKYYKDPLKWYIISDANDIINPFELILGQELIIPGNV